MALLALAGLSRQSFAQDESAGLLETLSSLPRDICYEMVLAGVGENQARSFALYDAGSGIFAFAARDNLSVWKDGTYYTGAPKMGGLGAGTATPHWVGQTNESAGRYFPIAWGFYILEYPERVESITPMDGGGWRAVLRVDSAVEGRPDEMEHVDFDAQGLIRQVQAVPGQERPNVYDYRTDYPAAWMVLSDRCIATLFPGFGVERLSAKQPAPHGAAELPHIEQLAAEADVDTMSWPVEKVAAWRQGRGLPPLQPAPNIGRGLADAQGEWTPWRRPLIAGGALVIGIACYGLWRRRSG